MGSLAGDAGLLTLRRAERLLPFVAGAVLVAGVLVFVLDRGGDAAGRQAARAPVAPAAVETARAFIRTAVQRRDLERAYGLVSPRLRRGYSPARWRTGRIPVVPFPGERLRIAPFVTWLSTRGRAILATELVSSTSPATPFTIGLVEREGRWLVDSWAPSRARRPGG